LALANRVFRVWDSSCITQRNTYRVILEKIVSREGYFWRLSKTYTVKKLFDISVPSRDVTYQTLPGRE
jgi:hypothetical protein